MQELVDAIQRVVAVTGPWAPLVLFGASLVEYVFPPFPGDLVVVLGAWYAVHGELSWPATFTVTTAGAVLGAWIDFRVGRAVGRRLDTAAARKGPLSAERLAHFEAAYRRWGAWLLLANRFMPGIRAFLFVAAGAAGIPMRRVLVLGGVSAAAWNVLLLGAGAGLARNAEELVHLFEHYTRFAWLALVLVGIAVGARWLVVRRRGRKA